MNLYFHLSPIEQPPRPPRCNYTEVLAGDTGEHSAPCGSLAEYIASSKEEEFEVCEFHAAICVLASFHVEEIRRLS